MAAPIWCIDTSSLINVRSLHSRVNLTLIFEGLSELAAKGRLRFPRQVVVELERYEGKDSPALDWIREHEGTQAETQPSYDDVSAVLRHVPEMLDADKEGVEEADAYVLALAYRLFLNDKDARLVTEEFKTTVAKMPLGSAAGYLRIPSVSLRTMLKFEDILEF